MATFLTMIFDEYPIAHAARSSFGFTLRRIPYRRQISTGIVGQGLPNLTAHDVGQTKAGKLISIVDSRGGTTGRSSLNPEFPHGCIGVFGSDDLRLSQARQLNWSSVFLLHGAISRRALQWTPCDPRRMLDSRKMGTSSTGTQDMASL